MSSCGGSNISIIEKARKRELGIFFCSRSSVRLREDLAELRHPQAENSVLFNALPSSLALSVDDIVEAAYPQAEISVLALPLQAAQHFIEELLIEARDASALVRALGLKQRAACVACRREAAGPSEQPQGRERPRPPTRRASPGAMPARTGRPLRKSSL